MIRKPKNLKIWTHCPKIRDGSQIGIFVKKKKTHKELGPTKSNIKMRDLGALLGLMDNKLRRGFCCYLLLVCVVIGVVPIVPATVCDYIIKVSIGIHNSGVFAHSTAHIYWPCTRDSAVYKSEACFLKRWASVLGCYGAELRSYGVQLAVLCQQIYQFCFKK